MHSRYFLGAFVVLVILFLSSITFAQPLKSKPVLCGQPSDAGALRLLQQIKKDGMEPLIGFRGNHFLEDGETFESDVFILYNPDPEQIIIIEYQDEGTVCLLAGTPGDISFDPELLRDVMGWDEIPLP